MEEYLKYIYHEDLYMLDEPEVVAEASPQTDADTQQVAEAQELPPVKFLGGNNKRTLILVNDPNNEFLNTKDLDFLMRIIQGGLKYSKLDIAIVNCLKFNYDQIFDEIDHDNIIAFGKHPVKYLGTEERYVVSTNKDKKILLAEELSEIAANRGKKSALWQALQIMFEINQ